MVIWSFLDIHVWKSSTNCRTPDALQNFWGWQERTFLLPKLRSWFLHIRCLFSPPALYLSPAWCEWVQLCGEQQWLRPLPPGPEAYGEWTPQLPCSFLPLGHYEHSYIQRVPFPSNKKKIHKIMDFSTIFFSSKRFWSPTTTTLISLRWRWCMTPTMTSLGTTTPSSSGWVLL